MNNDPPQANLKYSLFNRQYSFQEFDIHHSSFDIQ